jgi:hypothetical protein
MRRWSSGCWCSAAAPQLSIVRAAEQLEDRLLLTPRARRAAGLVVEPEPSKPNGKRRMSTRERERLLHG